MLRIQNSHVTACLFLCFVLTLAMVVGCGRAKHETAPVQEEKTGVGAEGEPAEEEEPDYATGNVVGLNALTTLKVDAGPKSVELMPGGRRIFVNDLYGHRNFIFSTEDYALEKTIPLPDEPVEADFTEDGKIAWVSLYNSAKVLVVDTEAGGIVGEVPTGSVPKEVAASPDGNWVYVSNWNSNTVSVIDAKARAKLKDIPVYGTPRGICFIPSGEFAYVCVMGGSTLAEINVPAGHEVSRQIPCGYNPRHVVHSPDASLLYVSNNSPGTVSVVDRVVGGVAATIKVGNGARTIDITPDGGYLFVCNYDDNKVGCVDLEALSQIFTVPSSKPIGLAVGARGERLFISNYAPPQVTVMEIAREE